MAFLGIQGPAVRRGIHARTLEGYAFTIQWFPGHMTKAKRQMESELRMVDVVVELLDARIPRASANPLLKGLIGSKVKIVALNKTDMA